MVGVSMPYFLTLAGARVCVTSTKTPASDASGAADGAVAAIDDGRRAAQQVARQTGPWFRPQA